MNFYSDRKNYIKFTNAKAVNNDCNLSGGNVLFKGGYRHVRMRKL